MALSNKQQSIENDFVLFKHFFHFMCYAYFMRFIVRPIHFCFVVVFGWQPTAELANQKHKPLKAFLCRFFGYSSMDNCRMMLIELETATRPVCIRMMYLNIVYSHIVEYFPLFLDVFSGCVFFWRFFFCVLRARVE